MQSVRSETCLKLLDNEVTAIPRDPHGTSHPCHPCDPSDSQDPPGRIRYHPKDHRYRGDNRDARLSISGPITEPHVPPRALGITPGEARGTQEDYQCPKTCSLNLRDSLVGGAGCYCRKGHFGGGTGSLASRVRSMHSIFPPGRLVWHPVNREVLQKKGNVLKRIP